MIFYLIRGGAYRSKGNTENPIEIYEEFKDNNPILARERAFRFYQNYIDVFLESKGKNYISHEQAEIDLHDFFNSFQKKYSIWGEIDADFGVCIQISFVHDDTVIHTLKNGIQIYEGEDVIHGIDKKNEDLSGIYFENLKLEYSIFEKNGFEMLNYKKGYDVSGLFEDEVIEFILETPMDYHNVLSERL